MFSCFSRRFPQFTRLLPSLVRLRSLDMSTASGAMFCVDLPQLSILLSCLPTSLHALNLRGWGVVMEPATQLATRPRQAQAPSAAAAVVGAGGAATTRETAAALRSRLRARTVVITCTMRAFAGTLQALAARVPQLECLCWTRLICGCGLLPHMLLAHATTSAALQASLVAAIHELPLLKSLSLCDPKDDRRFAAVLTSHGVRRATLTGGAGLTNAGSAAMGAVGSLVALRVDVSRCGRFTAAGLASLLRSCGRTMAALRIRGLTMGPDEEAVADVASALRGASSLRALEISCADGTPVVRLVRRGSDCRMAPAAPAEFDAAWALSWAQAIC